MFRALIELLIIVLIGIVARAVLTSIMKGVANASANAFRASNVQPPSSSQSSNAPPQTPSGGELHKDPVCGTYVAESTPFRQNISGQTFYYCSDACREKHALVAR
jgi:YHS domain-containing protein